MRKRERNRGARPPEMKQEAAGRHGRPGRARRRRPRTRYEARFSNPKTSRERGWRGECVPGLGMTRKLPRKATDGAAIDGTFGALGNDPREHHLAREKAEEGEEDEARSPTRRRKTKTAQSSGFVRPTKFSGDPATVLSARSRLGAEARGGKAKWARRTARARGGGSPT